MTKEHFTIKENSLIAWLAAKKLKATSVAIVIGSTIHLHNTSSAGFLSNPKWVKHELCHIQQFKDYGYFSFMVKYIWESIRHGYYNNKYEVEARKAEEY